MKIEVKEKTKGEFKLIINGEQILAGTRLGVVVDKIEAYLKMRFLGGEKKESILEKLKKF